MNNPKLEKQCEPYFKHPNNQMMNAELLQTISQTYDEFLETQVRLEARVLELEEMLLKSNSILNVTASNLSNEKSNTENKYKELFEKMADGIYKSTVEGKFIDVNPGLVKMLGYDSIEELLAIDIKKDLYFEESEREVDPVEEDGISVFRLRRKDGSEIWVEDRGQYITDDFGKILYHEGNLRDVTSRIRTEQHLHKSQKETSDYRKALDQSLIVSITNRDGIITYANENLCKISKYSKEELIGKPYCYINYQGEEDENILEQDRTVESGKVWRGEVKKKAKDGTIYWVDQTIVPFINEEGEIYQYLTIRIDITEKKNSEIRTRESEENFREIIQSSNDLIQSLNTDGTFDFVNASWLKTMGFTEEELSKMTIFDIISEDYLSKCLETFQRVLGGEKADNVKTIFITKSNKKVILEGSAVPKIKDNKVIGVRTFLRNVTEREVAEAQTAAVNEQLEIKIDQLKESQEVAQLGTWVLDFKTGKTSHSNEFYKILEREEKDFDIPVSEQLLFFHPDDRSTVKEAFMNVIQEQKGYQFEARLLMPDGRVKNIFAIGRCSAFEKGSPLRLLGTIQDITGRKIAEQKLENSISELKKTNSELDKFVYSVSHDLRAPLSSMLGVIEISEEDTTDEIMLMHLKMLKNNIKKLDGFISDILDYSRNARLDIKKEVIDFNEMLSDITQNLKYMGGINRIVDIQVEVNEKSKFFSDKSRLNIILNNLVSNAIRYQNEQTPNPFVNIKIDTSDTETGIIIKDNGIGISAESHAKVFEMFYRVSEASVGSGLGLYIVKEAVEKLHGEIELESAPGTGSIFKIRIPNN
ncbi:MAG: PAS domain S-box protein [Bacteroidia bacterium]|jgi:PAS domain S-box-containing protein|nr:PAS domain S-box protein [Bacteroidia bacterium]MBP7244874.1 PAS domain S-box protein [Bacteroidia bacterium]